jgi:hypothetical protein
LNKLKTPFIPWPTKTCNNNIEADLFNPYKLGVESHTPHVLESEKKTKTNKPSNVGKQTCHHLASSHPNNYIDDSPSPFV